MRIRFGTLSLACGALLLVAGGIIHARAYGGADAALATSHLPDFYATCMRALWLIDSATLITLGVTLGAVAYRPALSGALVIALVALVPIATAVLLYRFLGPRFPPAPMLLVAGLLGLGGGVARHFGR